MYGDLWGLRGESVCVASFWRLARSSVHRVGAQNVVYTIIYGTAAAQEKNSTKTWTREHWNSELTQERPFIDRHILGNHAALSFAICKIEPPVFLFSFIKFIANVYLKFLQKDVRLNRVTKEGSDLHECTMRSWSASKQKRQNKPFWSHLRSFLTCGKDLFIRKRYRSPSVRYFWYSFASSITVSLIIFDPHRSWHLKKGLLLSSHLPHFL